MKKILIVTPRFPYPVIGGDRLRIFEICRELSKTYSLTLLSLCETYDEYDWIIPDDGVFNTVERVYLSKKRSYFNSLCALATTKPLQVAYYNSFEFSKKIKKLSSTHDLVIGHLIRVAPYMENLSIPKVLELTDAISLNYSRIQGIGKHSRIMKVIYKLEKSRVLKYEKKAVLKCDLSSLVSIIDRDYLISNNVENSGAG